MKDTFCRPTDERAVISCCMADINNYFSVCSKLRPSDFLYPQHELLMLLLESLAVRGFNRFEYNAVVAEASASGVIDSIGGLKYIQTISNMNVDASNVSMYIESVYNASVKYRLHKELLRQTDKVLKNSKDGLDGASLISGVESSIMDLSTRGLGLSEPINLKDGLSDFIESKRDNPITLSGMSTGYPILDKQIDGLLPGSLLVIAARKKMGKSTLLSNISAHIAYRLQVPILYIDTELRFEEWRTRLLAILSGVNEREIKYGGYKEETYHRLRKAEAIIEKGNLLHEYMPGYTVDKVVALYKKYKHKIGMGLMVFDYLKEPDSSSVDKQRKDYQILGDVTTKLKDLAGTLNIPAVTAVQLNRSDDIADSDRIARYADVVCLWGNRTNEEKEIGGLRSGTHKLVIRDSRRGGGTSEHGIGYSFKKEKLIISEVSIDEQYFTDFSKIVNDNSATGEDETSDEPKSNFEFL